MTRIRSAGGGEASTAHCAASAGDHHLGAPGTSAPLLWWRPAPHCAFLHPARGPHHKKGSGALKVKGTPIRHTPVLAQACRPGREAVKCGSVSRGMACAAPNVAAFRSRPSPADGSMSERDRVAPAVSGFVRPRGASTELQAAFEERAQQLSIRGHVGNTVTASVSLGDISARPRSQPRPFYQP